MENGGSGPAKATDFAGLQLGRKGTAGREKNGPKPRLEWAGTRERNEERKRRGVGPVSGRNEDSAHARWKGRKFFSIFDSFPNLPIIFWI
jgi:hypothetical protein